MNKLRSKNPTMRALLIAGFVLAFASTGWMSAAAQEAEMTLLFSRTCQISQGKGPQATQWAREMSEYLQGRDPGRGLGVYRQAFGPLGQVTFFSRHASLAAFEEQAQALGEDSGYRERLAKAMGLFTGCEDKLFRAIP